MTKQDGPDIFSIIKVPAILTLVITLVRLLAEFGNLPAWLASKEPGGAGAIIGISWLPPILGVYFAMRLIGEHGTFWKNLLKTLFYYGLAARIPVIIIMGLAIAMNWGTHYDAFPPEMADASFAMKFVVGGVVAQLVWWAGIYTVGTGMLTGMIASKFLSGSSKAAHA